MARYPQGQPVRLSVAVRQLNVDGTTTLVNPTTLTFTVQTGGADGTAVTTGTYAAPTNDGVGLYHQDVPAADLTAVGHYQWKAVSTGPGAGVQVGDFDVFDPFEIAVLPLADAKDMLNIPQANTSSDTEIASFIAAIESSLERFTGGPIINRQVTERVEVTSGYTVLCLRQRPLVSLVSVISAASGTALSIADMTDLDRNAATVRRSLGLPFYGPYFAWMPIFNVTYVAGWGTAVPPAFNTAARIILRNLWDTQRGVTALPMQGGDETVTPPGFAFAIPNRAAELLNGSQGGIPFLLEAFI